MVFSRRGFLGLGAAGFLAACDSSLIGNGVDSNGAAKVDARVDATRDYLFSNYPGTQDLSRNARGILYMPLVTEIGARMRFGMNPMSHRAGHAIAGCGREMVLTRSSTARVGLSLE